MKYSVLKFSLLVSFFPLLLAAQKNDTIVITAKAIQVSQLKESKSNYLVYFVKGENAPASDLQLWHIDVKREQYNNREAITVTQQWDYKDTVIHTAKSVCMVDDFKPIYHESWWKNRGRQAFDLQQHKAWINETELTAADTSTKSKAVFKSFNAANNYFLNWHLDLEVFAMLPYKMNRTFLIPFYEFGYDIPRNIPYAVSGVGELAYAGNKITCWLLTHEEEGNSETFWISKETNEVLKLVQKINSKMYRYKIKLPSGE